MMWPLIFFFFDSFHWLLQTPLSTYYMVVIFNDSSMIIAQLLSSTRKPHPFFLNFYQQLDRYIYIHRFRVKRRERNTWPTVNLYSTYIYASGEMQKLTSRQVFCFNENINTGILCSICPKGKGKGICRYRILVLD